MDADCVNKFIEATLHILETTAGTTAKAKKPYLKQDQTAPGAISGLIDVSGDFKGSIAVSFSESLILHIVSAMFGEEMKHLNDEIKDAVGEIANMISGQATIKLAESGKKLKAKMSSVQMGPSHPITHLTGRPVVALPYGTTHGNFTIEACSEKW
ncbi:MAG: chemotaxis protein CheX [Thermodesulfobacteriota bacterium]